MPITAQWAIEERLIEVKSVGEVETADALQVGREIVQLLDASTSDKVHLIIDESQLKNMNIQLSGLSELTMIKHPRVGWIVTWGSQQNAFFSFLQTMVAQMAGLNWRKFNTEAEARQFVEALLAKPENSSS
jgi:hypothetical protein